MRHLFVMQGANALSDLLHLYERVAEVLLPQQIITQTAL